MPIAFILLNSDLGSDQEIITKLKEMLAVEKGIKSEVQGVYGIYDIVVKIEAASSDLLRSIITSKIRKIDKVQSTLTMMVIEEQERL
ncbi:MAG: Lrp/AsnC family transcriptional regulator [Nitrososphaeria archaeon]|nr:Lrp/AsnC family transcriptional regulator [Nitrosopumilaceae archaeon]NDB89789.1 Lrp/AsnC family transcriptional regulator [Nitrososphaerota archaeon]NDF28957.1 Lrp/AsnC family transcriptional regulator [Nitrososphaeria archaeon]NDF26284.1 Lrp/AsnC family transcriptional regulator [Nitrosopumilaceae archaeon]NDF34588.1 Lrp/AsnC family transcriptional regulator [Nitrosopumilaceae archaeon]